MLLTMLKSQICQKEKVSFACMKSKFMAFVQMGILVTNVLTNVHLHVMVPVQDLMGGVLSVPIDTMVNIATSAVPQVVLSSVTLSVVPVCVSRRWGHYPCHYYTYRSHHQKTDERYA